MTLVAFGYADLNLISFHLQRSGGATAVTPWLYALAMGVAAVSAPIFGS
ncbi:MAG TPA: hypothetical protein VKY90_13200 [Candidatus Dormibacteraeota bacterium]|nr:hypothetical protein [Candidatus Dormibacteraeota bacterium]